MALDHLKLLSQPVRETRQAFTRRDTILYALGVGAGIEAAEDGGLQFVYEEELEALPTMAAVMASSGFWQREPQNGINWQMVVHGEQFGEFYRPFPVEGEVLSEFRISEIYDKGPEKGALAYATRTLYEASSGDLLAKVTTSSLLRGDGGFGGETVNPHVPYAIPGGSDPDFVVRLRSRPEQAMIYRLSGDYNPQHIDPAIAREGGFERPILHGLCTYGMAGRAAISALCSDPARPARLTRLDVRFTSPVFPGDTLDFQIWKTGEGKAGLRARAVERDVLVLDHGYVEFEEK